MLENLRLVVSHHSPQGENDSGGRSRKINIINNGIEEINDRKSAPFVMEAQRKVELSSQLGG